MGQDRNMRFFSSRRGGIRQPVKGEDQRNTSGMVSSHLSYSLFPVVTGLDHFVLLLECYYFILLRSELCGI